jgi:integrase
LAVGRADNFLNPIAGLDRDVGPSARERTLSDDGLRAIWPAATAFPGPYGYIVKFALLTATRRSEAGKMAWSELQGGDWIIPGARTKNGLEHVVPLSPAAVGILAALPRLGDFAFTVDGRRPFTNFHTYKRQLDEASGVIDLVFHDLRRTARSLLSRAGVLPDHAERCLAHKVGGIRGVYDSLCLPRREESRL